MKKLLILISAACLLIPALVFGQNANPMLYLEIYDSDAHCICPYVRGGDPLPCYRPLPKAQWMPAYIFIHVAKVENGYLGVPFGMVTSGGAMFSSCTACPGFLKGPSSAGEPAAVIVSSTALCHPWNDHPIYCMWLSQDGNDETWTLVASADLGHYYVINCLNEYDFGTTLGHGAAWAATNPLVCAGDPTPVEETTWGKIKGLYR
ncbi:MAG: hypothetical protein AMJ46_00875 [Latescibacteria bacterium DG_63]|nr:MAG: hypothetical protein AMJ46_00875 [Latescibacteria bacterium DG_63]